MTTTAAAVAIHRFRDCAGLSVLRAAGTVYLDAAAARELAAALLRVARSVERESFVDSPPLSANVPAFRDAAAIVSAEEHAAGAVESRMAAERAAAAARSCFWGAVSHATGAGELAGIRGTLGRAGAVNRAGELALDWRAGGGAEAKAATLAALDAMRDAAADAARQSRGALDAEEAAEAAEAARDAATAAAGAFRAAFLSRQAAEAATRRAIAAEEAAKARKSGPACHWRAGAAQAAAKARQELDKARAYESRAQAREQAARGAA